MYARAVRPARPPGNQAAPVRSLVKCTFLTARAMRPAERPADHLTPDEVAAYLDGEAGSVERRSIEAHLATCEACLRDMVAVLRVVGRPPRGEP